MVVLLKGAFAIKLQILALNFAIDCRLLSPSLKTNEAIGKQQTLLALSMLIKVNRACDMGNNDSENNRTNKVSKYINLRLCQSQC